MRWIIYRDVDHPELMEAHRPEIRAALAEIEIEATDEEIDQFGIAARTLGTSYQSMARSLATMIATFAP